MNIIIKPEPGRQVQYWPCAIDLLRTTMRNSVTPFAATIAYADSDRSVTLSVIDHTGKQFIRSSILLLQPGDAPAPHGLPHATWPTHVLAQAAQRGQAIAYGTRPDTPPAFGRRPGAQRLVPHRPRGRILQAIRGHLQPWRRTRWRVSMPKPQAARGYHDDALWRITATALPRWEELEPDDNAKVEPRARANSMLGAPDTLDSQIGWANGTGPNIPAAQDRTPDLPGRMAFNAAVILLRDLHVSTLV